MSPFVQDRVSAVAAAAPKQCAIQWGIRTMDYATLESRSNAIANTLLEHGEGLKVVLAAADPIAMMSAILGVLKAGGIFVPIDPRQPSARLQTMLDDVAPDLFLHDGGEGEEMAARLARRCPLQAIEAAARGPDVRPRIAGDPDAPCYVYFSSGTTGRPKGIVGRLKAIAHFIDWEREALSIPDGVRVAQLTTPSFDAYLRDMLVPLCSGGTVCAPADREIVLDPRRLLAWLEQERIALLHCVPSLFFTLLGEPLAAERLPALRHILLAGEVLPPGAVDRFMSVFGERIQLVNLYGPSETTMVKFAHFVGPADRTRNSVPIGKPIPGCDALLIDEGGQACPLGSVGELFIRTPYRSLGYLNQPHLTAKAFIQNPLSDAPGDIVYRTGDLARQLPDGAYEFLGRKDRQVKIRGVRVELAEVEDVLRRHPAIVDAAAVMRDDDDSGPRLCAFVTLRDGAQADDLTAYLVAHLPEEMRPSALYRLDVMPRTASGKLDRLALPLPSEASRLEEAAYVAPRDGTEQRLADIWTDLLKRPQIGRDDDFFASGGDSLMAISVVSRAALEFGVEVPLRCLFEAPTLAAFAALVERAQQEVPVALESGEL